MDIASRYVDAEPLSSKNSSPVVKAFERIYSRKKLKFPHTLIVDPGKEFMGGVTTLMNKHKVRIQRSEAKSHRAQAVVESHQYAQEILEEGERSRVWVNRLRGVL